MNAVHLIIIELTFSSSVGQDVKAGAALLFFNRLGLTSGMLPRVLTKGDYCHVNMNVI